MNLNIKKPDNLLLIFGCFSLLLIYMFVFLHYQHLVTSFTEQGMSLQPIFLKMKLKTLITDKISLTNIIYNLLAPSKLSFEQIIYILIFINYILFIFLFFRAASLRANPLAIFIPLFLFINTKFMLQQLTALNFHIEQASWFLLLLFYYQKTQKLKIKYTSYFYFIILIYSLFKYNNFILYAGVIAACEIFTFLLGKKTKDTKKKLVLLGTPIILLAFIITNINDISVYIYQKPLLFKYSASGSHLAYLKNSFGLFMQNVTPVIPKTYLLLFALSLFLYALYLLKKFIKKEDYKIPLLIFALTVVPLITHILTIDCSFAGIDKRKEGTRFADIFPALILIPFMMAELLTLTVETLKTKRKQAVLLFLTAILLLHIISEKNFSLLFFDNPFQERKNITSILLDMRKHIKWKTRPEIIVLLGKDQNVHKFLFGFEAFGAYVKILKKPTLPLPILRKIEKEKYFVYFFKTPYSKERTTIYLIPNDI